MNQLIHEIEDSLRQERLHAWWKEYGPYLIAGCVLAVLFTAVAAGWRAHQAGVYGRQTAMIADAMASPDAAALLLKAAPGLKPSLRALALLNAANAQGQKPDNAAALATYRRAVADSRLPEPFHSFAVLQAARFGAAAPAPDDKALLASLQPLTRDAKNPWTGEARLEGALIAAHGLHDYKQARALLAPLLSATAIGDSSQAPLTARAAALDHLYAAEMDVKP